MVRKTSEFRKPDFPSSQPENAKLGLAVDTLNWAAFSDRVLIESSEESKKLGF
jgi:hypothetical protein